MKWTYLYSLLAHHLCGPVYTCCRAVPYKTGWRNTVYDSFLQLGLLSPHDCLDALQLVRSANLCIRVHRGWNLKSPTIRAHLTWVDVLSFSGTYIVSDKMPLFVIKNQQTSRFHYAWTWCASVVSVTFPFCKLRQISESLVVLWQTNRWWYQQVLLRIVF